MVEVHKEGKYAYEEVKFSYNEEVDSFSLNGVELCLTEDVLAWLEFIVASSRWRKMRRDNVVVSKKM